MAPWTTRRQGVVPIGQLGVAMVLEYYRLPMNPLPARPVDLCSRCGSTQTAANSCPCGNASSLAAAPRHRRAWVTLGIGGALTLTGGCMGALSSHSNSMLSEIEVAVHAVVGATIGFAMGMVLALAVYVGSKGSR